ncbi:MULTISPECIES: helix-turn-helix domain-containing protein [Bacillaceae]|uniref:Helix-turn-helix transcriptional regulator n=1 Tax=Evansella alkalicola TaxID=745819 RepID=A0ABS6JUB6_9BACI|nr:MULTISPECIES: helix-turn-helix transcriptional regulator [Bacillaceae]MBU9722165.1 helix-turn-helix transcriptional regulator [Bacillus alkalicola]
MDFKDYLKTKRKEKNLSMNKLGQISGVSAMYISQIERGRRVTPTPKIIAKLAEGLKEPYDELMKVAGYMPVEEFIEDLSETIQGNSVPTHKVVPQEASEDGEEQFDLDYILDSRHKIFFQDRLLTKEEISKVKSLIEIVLKD